MDFAEWLQQELNKRKWSHNEFGRRCGVAQAQISRVISGARQAGPDLCVAIAKGLALSREEVFRARGWLLHEPEKVFEPEFDPRALGLAKKVSGLPFESREVTLNVMETVLESTYQLTQIRESAAEYKTS